MKKKIFAGLMALVVAVMALACFNSDPNSRLNLTVKNVTGGGGESLGIATEWDENWTWEWPDWTFEWKDDPDYTFDFVVMLPVSFPFTLNTTFSGFIDPNTMEPDTSPVTRMILFYYDAGQFFRLGKGVGMTAAGWVALKDIKNPAFDVVTERPLALFGQRTFPTAMGYQPGSAIPVVMYFETEAGNKSFDLEVFLENRKIPGAALKAGATVIGLEVRDNTNPF